MRSVVVIVGRSPWPGRPPPPCPAGSASRTRRQARTEVTAAAVGTTIVVAGGFTGDGRSTARVDAYDTRADRWSRLPDLPVAVHHAMAASDGRRVYVVGGYLARSALTHATRRAFSLRPGDRAWRELRRMPVSRAAGGAAVVGNRLYVVGGTFGVTPALARRSFALDLATGRWSAFPGVPQPREHLGAAALGGRVYVLGGRTAAERFRRADAWDVRLRRWVRIPDMPTARGGTAATARAGTVVSIGGESSAGTEPRGRVVRPGDGTLAPDRAAPGGPPRPRRRRGGQPPLRPDGRAEARPVGQRRHVPAAIAVASAGRGHSVHRVGCGTEVRGLEAAVLHLRRVHGVVLRA